MKKLTYYIFEGAYGDIVAIESSEFRHDRIASEFSIKSASGKVVVKLKHDHFCGSIQDFNAALAETAVDAYLEDKTEVTY